MAKTRIPIPAKISASIQFRSDRTCCVCRESGRPTQIHHIEDDPSNNDPDNLALLCLICHDETQITGGFGRKLDARQVKAYRDDWFTRVQERRENTGKTITDRTTPDSSAGAVTARTAEMRPWISLTCGIASGFHRGTTHLGVEGYYLSFRGIANNHGRSPATNVVFRAELGLLGEGRSPENMMDAFCKRFRDIPDQTAQTIFPDAALEVGHELFLPQKDIDAALAPVAFKAIFPVICGCIHYKSAYTEGIRQTQFAYLLCRVRDNGQPMVLLQDGPNWLEAKIALVEPSLSVAD